MALTTAGRDFIASAIIGADSLPYNATNAHIGVGDSTVAFSAAQTDLQSATNKIRKGMEANYPTVSVNVMTFRALFAVDQANFAWEEWGVFNQASGGAMLSRKVEALGTKTSAQSWQMTVDITVNIGT